MCKVPVPSAFVVVCCNLPAGPAYQPLPSSAGVSQLNQQHLLTQASGHGGPYPNCALLTVQLPERCCVVPDLLHPLLAQAPGSPAPAGTGDVVGPHRTRC